MEYKDMTSSEALLGGTLIVTCGLILAREAIGLSNSKKWTVLNEVFNSRGRG